MADKTGYIGRAPGDSAVTVARQTFHLLESQQTLLLRLVMYQDTLISILMV